MLKKIKKSEKGSITILVLTTMLVVVGVIFIVFFSMMNKSNSQERELDKIQEEYNQAAGSMEQAYDEFFGNEDVNQPEPDPEPEEPVVAKYTVTYNYSANGGTSASKSTATVEEGKQVDLTPTASKNGYDFVGWNKNENAQEKLNSLEMGNSNITLYAIYKKDITTTFNYWDGTKPSSTSKTVTIYNKETQGTVTSPIINNTSKNGTTYTARGWSKENNGNASTETTSGGRITISKNTDFYALYQGEASATFYYYNGSKQTSAPGNASTTMNASGEVTTGTMNVPTEVTRSSGPNGTSYKGIATQPNSTESATVNSSNTTYYAFYSTQVIFYYGSGSHKTGTRTATTNGSYYSTSISNQPSPGNYDSATFKYWSRTSGQDSQADPSSTSYTAYYAVYTRTIIAYFKYYNGYSTSTAQSSSTRTYISTQWSVNKLQTNISIPESVTRSSGPNGTTYSYISDSTYGLNQVTPSTDGGTYYAVYEKDITITRMMYRNHADKSLTGKVKGLYDGTIQGENINLGSASTSAPTGYKFRGWSTSTSTNPTSFVTTIYNVTDDATYYASYQKLVTVSYDTNGGTGYIYPDNITSYMNYTGSTSGSSSITLPSGPTRSGYTFIGWGRSSYSGVDAGYAGETYKPDSDITLYAQWQIAASLEEGDYVWYTDKKGTRRKCIVLYDKSSEYGIQIITMETVEDVEIGNGTGISKTFQSPNDQYFITALESYNNAIVMLNSKAMDYMNEDYATDARCVGSVPNDKNLEGSGYYTHTSSWFSAYDNKFKNGDGHYKIDFEQMEKIGGIIIIDKGYWFASRTIDAMSAAVYPNIYVCDPPITNGIANIFQLNSSTKKSFSKTKGLRPVFTLKDEVKITGGSGTEDDPYTLGV